MSKRKSLLTKLEQKKTANLAEIEHCKETIKTLTAENKAIEKAIRDYQTAEKSASVALAFGTKKEPETEKKEPAAEPKKEPVATPKATPSAPKTAPVLNQKGTQTDQKIDPVPTQNRPQTAPKTAPSGTSNSYFSTPQPYPSDQEIQEEMDRQARRNRFFTK